MKRENFRKPIASLFNTRRDNYLCVLNIKEYCV